MQPGDSDREWRPSGDPISAQQLATTLPGQLAQGGVETLGGQGGGAQGGLFNLQQSRLLTAEAAACKRVGHGSRQIRPAECRRRQEEGAERRAAGDTQVFVWRAALIHISSFSPASKASDTRVFLLEHPRRKLCFPRGPPRSVLHSLLGLASARSALTEKQREIQSISPVKGDLRRYIAFNP